MSGQTELQRLFDEYAKRQEATRHLSLLYMVVAVAVTVGCLVLIGHRVRTAEAEVQAAHAERDSERAELDKLRAQRDSLNSEIDEKTVAVKVLNDQLQRQDAKLGGLASAAKQGGDAKATLDRVQKELASDERSTPTESAQAIWSKGYSAYTAGRYDDAVRYYQQALQADPNFAPALNSLGRIALVQNDLPTAEKDFRDSIAKQSDYVPALDNLARIELKKGHYAEAERLVTEGLRYRPGYVPAEQLLKEIQTKSSSGSVSKLAN